MNNIFIGMLLVFFDFHLDINASRIGLIPTFIGYIFIARGLRELVSYSARFSRVSPFVTGMIVYTGICYAMDLVGISSMIETTVNLVLGLVSTIISLYISHGIIMGIKNIEAAWEQDLYSGRLYSIWKLLAVLSLLVYPLYFAPALTLVCIIMSFLISACYIYAFYQTKNRFYALNSAE